MLKGNQKDFTQFDLWAFCSEAGGFQSDTFDFSYSRLKNDPSIIAYSQLNWSLSGMKTSGGESYAEIAGSFQASLVCAHCGQGVDSQIDVHRRWLLKPSEKVAEAFDTDDLDDDIDVVACPNHINLETWIEDELLLSLPMFARHEFCQEKIDNQVLSAADQSETRDTIKPFSQLGEMLAKVKKSN